jgi:hypothetical protein
MTYRFVLFQHQQIPNEDCNSGQPFHHFLHSKIFPKTLDKSTTRGKVDWFIVTFSYLVVGFIISNAVPFFEDVQNLIGSLVSLNKNYNYGSIRVLPITPSSLTISLIIHSDTKFGAPIVFGWPVTFYVSMRYHEAGGSWQGALKRMGYWHILLCGIFFFVFLPLFCIVGTVSGVLVLVKDVGDSGKPFSC